MVYIKRNYRNKVSSSGLTGYNVILKETDLFVSTKSDLKERVLLSLSKHRDILEKYINKNPGFKTAMEPVDIDDKMSGLVKKMVEGSLRAGVGPMAAVAGVLAEAVGLDLMEYSKEVIVENGGDIFLKVCKERTVAVFAGESPFNMKLGIKIDEEMTPLNICTSSGTVGHSISYGNADAVVCISKDGSTADASATAVGNVVIDRKDVDEGLEFARKIDGIDGCLVIYGDKMGVVGNIEICKIN